MTAQVLDKYETPILLAQPSIPVPWVSYGVVVSITPTDNTYQIEVYRAPDDGAGNPDVGNAVLVDTRLYAAHGDVLADALPNDNAKRFYRWRHVVAGGTAGSYTAWVWARPDFLPQTYPQQKTLTVPLRSMPFADGSTNLAAQDATGQTATGDVYVLNSKTVKVGSLASPSTITKTMRITAASFRPATDGTDKWQFPLRDASPLTANVLMTQLASLILPPGVTMTAMRARYTRVTVNDTAQLILYRITVPTQANVATLTHAGTGIVTDTASISEFVGTSTTTYWLKAALKGIANSTDAAFEYAEIDYTMPSYDKGL